ncbi:hypothetical protein INP57_19400 [Saccharopolyspora sp. HNM0986]|uniref:hypothetical protein n=1 Tax=Saccharopolyspora galaxeae TaxID=2781241 RepID=UPI00190E53A1|nr:hypothetical protein [Saccharopolyspora sp. HNM0986]
MPDCGSSSSTNTTRSRSSATPRSSPTTPASAIPEVTTAASEYYAEQLDAHPEALDYLRGRFGDEIDTLRERFTIGYAPDGWRHLTNHLRAQGFSEQDLLDAGVAKQSRTGSLIDRMRDRIVVGFRDADGRVAGFAGRPPHENFDKSRTPKYLNPPRNGAVQEIRERVRAARAARRGRGRWSAGAGGGNDGRSGPGRGGPTAAHRAAGGQRHRGHRNPSGRGACRRG